MATDTPAVGSTIWSKGDEYLVVNAPFIKDGIEWIDAIGVENGRAITVPTPRHREAMVKQKQAEWREQQAQFRRLREIS